MITLTCLDEKMKDNNTTTYGLNPGKVAEILNIANDTDSNSVDIKQNKSDLIIEKLNEAVPIYFALDQNPKHRLRRLRHTIAVLSGEPIGKLLDNPKTDVKLTRMIKEHARKLSSHAESELEHHISNTIYYAAIAHALIFHNVKITNYSYESLLKSYEQLSKEIWIPKNILDLFIKVAEYCKTKIE